MYIVHRWTITGLYICIEVKIYNVSLMINRISSICIPCADCVNTNLIVCNEYAMNSFVFLHNIKIYAHLTLVHIIKLSIKVYLYCKLCDYIAYVSQYNIRRQLLFGSIYVPD